MTRQTAQVTTPAAYRIERRGRFWEVLDRDGELVCLTVYKRGAQEVLRRLGGDRVEGPAAAVQAR